MKNIISLFTPRTKPPEKMSLHQKKKKRKIIEVHIHSISSTVLKQFASTLTKSECGKKFNNNNQQQPSPKHRYPEKKSHSQSSNKINFSDQAQNSSKKNSTCEETIKLHIKYQQDLSRILKNLETLHTDICSITTEKKKQQHNTPNTNIALLFKKLLLLQNNDTSLSHNRHLTTHAKKCNCTETKQIADLYKKSLLNMWKSLETLYTKIDTPSSEKQKKQKNDTSLYPNNTNCHHNSSPTNNFQKTVSENYIMTHTQLYGKIEKDKKNKITKVTLHQHEVALTQEEINNRNKEQFPIDLHENKMLRCPLKSCNHKPLNTYFIVQHLLQHCQVYHNNDNKQYIFRCQTQYGKKKIHYPPTLSENNN